MRWRKVSPLRNLTPLDIVAIDIVRRAFKDWSAFHADFTYELAMYTISIFDIENEGQGR